MFAPSPSKANENDLRSLDTPDHDQSVQLDATLSPPPKRSFHPDTPPELQVSEWSVACWNLAIGGAIIRYFCNPATFRRRFTLLGLHSAFTWWGQHRSVSRAPFLDMLVTLNRMDNLNEEFDKKPQSKTIILLCYPLLVYGNTPSIREAHYDTVRSRVTDEMVTKYLQEEDTRDRSSSLKEYLAFKYRNYWSSVKTRASISEILHTAIAQQGLEKDIEDQDIRRCVSHIADALENGMRIEDTILPVKIYWAGFLTMMFFSAPLLLRTAVCTTTSAVMAHIYYHGHITQVESEVLKYSRLSIGANLHQAYLRRVMD